MPGNPAKGLKRKNLANSADDGGLTDRAAGLRRAHLEGIGRHGDGLPEKGGLHAFRRAVEAYGEGAVRGAALVAEHAALGITHKKLAVRKGRAAAPQGRQAFQHGDDVCASVLFQSK